MQAFSTNHPLPIAMLPLPVQEIPSETVAAHLFHLRDINPLVHCLTNDVVQEITANVLLAAGASPAMVVAPEEAGIFAAKVNAVLVNVGTPRSEMVEAMHLAVKSANRHNVPWVLDPVAAGVIPWRDNIIQGLLNLKPTVIRANASEILACAHQGAGGKGVDSTDKSEAAVPAAIHLARTYECVVSVTGAVDYVTDGKTLYSIHGGSPKATIVVGTGCSLSALMAAFISRTDHVMEAAASCCAFAKRAQQQAASISTGPGSFKVAYLDALHLIEPKDFF